MHIGVSAQRTELAFNAQHLVVHVDDNLFNELEETFDALPDDEVKRQTEPKHIGICPTYIIHFICDLRCDTLRWLSGAINTYAAYFIELHISLSSQIEDAHLSTNANTNPSRISQCIGHLKNVLLNSDLSLDSFHLYINITSNVYDDVYCNLLRIWNDALFEKFMNIPHGKNQSLRFIFALPEESIKRLNQKGSTSSNNYWDDIHYFLSHSRRMHHMELVVKTGSSLYTNSDSHGVIFNKLLRYINENTHSKVIHSLKLTCWGFLNGCSAETQAIFAKYLKDIIISKGIQKLWLRYAGINECILSDVFEAVRENANLTDLKIQRMLLNKGGKCLTEFGKVISSHVSVEHVEIGWNMASIPDTKYYSDLLNGIASNCYNLKRIEVYADNECTVNVLATILGRNVILQHIKLHMIDWNEIEVDGVAVNDADNGNKCVNRCSEQIDVMMENQMYLQLQMKAVKEYLTCIAEFPNGLTMNVLDFMYPKKYSLNVEVVMNFEGETYHSIMDIWSHKKAKSKEELDGDLVPRQLKFQITKPWPA
eukprot:194229_1